MAVMPTPYRPPMPYRLPWQMPIAKLPPAKDHAGQKVWVLDLHEGLPGYCASDGVAWIPDRTLAIATRSAATAVKLVPLVHRPIQRFTATIPVSGLAVTLDTAGAWNGLTWRIMRIGGGTGVLSVIGKTLSAGQVIEIAFDGAAYVQISPVSLL
ncbi:MAG: hypothetical protein FJ335_02455 [Sphingomonadales bacterium]|nr:hypothetical protein [Sphingomonadales bacterium]